MQQQGCLLTPAQLLNPDGSAYSGTLQHPHLMLYFSAHWCPPCKMFTPMLTKWYTEHKGKLDMELVFISSDRDADAFKHYSASMSFPALNYGDRALKEQLSRRYKVEGIPTLIVVDAKTGTLVSGDGREGVMEAPENFPWKPRTVADILQDKMIRAGGVECAKPLDELKGKVVALYFGASWCGPCKKLSPSLVNTYNACKASNKPFEVVFVPLDREEGAFNEYLTHMPWLSLPFADIQSRSMALARMHEVQGIPHVVLLDGTTFKMINKDARFDIDEAGEGYPWKPKPIRQLDPSTASSLNERPTVLVIGAADDEKAFVGACTGIANQVLAEAEAQGEDPKVQFLFAASNNPIVPMIKQFLGLSRGGGCGGHSHDHDHSHGGHDDHEEDDHSHNHDHAHESDDHGHSHSHDHNHGHDHGHEHDHAHDHGDDAEVCAVLIDIENGRKFLLGDEMTALPELVTKFLKDELEGGVPLRSHHDEEDDSDDDAHAHGGTEDPRITAAAESKLCSFTVTGKDYALQRWFGCNTCKLNDSEGCCFACATECHKGHDVFERGITKAFCDCGAGGADVCKSLSK